MSPNRSDLMISINRHRFLAADIEKIGFGTNFRQKGVLKVLKVRGAHHDISAIIQHCYGVDIWSD